MSEDLSIFSEILTAYQKTIQMKLMCFQLGRITAEGVATSVIPTMDKSIYYRKRDEIIAECRCGFLLL